jgi:hypothetical protein
VEHELSGQQHLDGIIQQASVDGFQSSAMGSRLEYPVTKRQLSPGNVVGHRSGLDSILQRRTTGKECDSDGNISSAQPSTPLFSDSKPATTFKTSAPVAKATAVALPSNSNSLTVSTEGNCGNGVTCKGSSFGDCCSSHGYCGSSDQYCSAGCNSAFGTCGGQYKRDDHNHMHVHKHKRAVRVGGDARMMP